MGEPFNIAYSQLLRVDCCCVYSMKILLCAYKVKSGCFLGEMCYNAKIYRIVNGADQLCAVVSFAYIKRRKK